MDDLDEDPTTTFDNLDDNFGNDNLDDADLDGTGGVGGDDDDAGGDIEGEDDAVATSTGGGGKSRAAKRRSKAKGKNVKKAPPESTGEDVIDLVDDDETDPKDQHAHQRKEDGANEENLSRLVPLRRDQVRGRHRSRRRHQEVQLQLLPEARLQKILHRL